MTLDTVASQIHFRSRFAVDAHVHFHEVGLVERTLDSAAENFSRAGAAPTGFLGALLLAESSREHVFDELAGSVSCGRWRLHAVSEEPQTIVASSDDRKIAIICGSQVRCTLGLEVIALGTTSRYPDGDEPGATIDRIRADGAPAVVPWGFGKWLGLAGSAVGDLFSSRMPNSLYAGDNGGRLQLLGMPGLLKDAVRRGIRVLPGTDPFPFGSDYRRVGNFGFFADVIPDESRPWASLHQWLESHSGSPEAYGQAMGPLRFVFNQGWIQIHNRMPRRATS